MAVTHLLLDFFGTIVDYVPGVNGTKFAASHELVRALGVRVPDDEFVDALDASFALFEARSEADHREFSMDEACAHFLRGFLPAGLADQTAARFAQTCLGEWNRGVSYRTERVDAIRHLASTYRLAIVTNTHDRDLVPGHVNRMGLQHAFDAIVTSVGVGWKKPHRAIYETALETLGIEASQALFVGDTYVADYLGPRSVGIDALLIDPGHRTQVPEVDRLSSFVDLLTRISDPRHAGATPPLPASPATPPPQDSSGSAPA